MDIRFQTAKAHTDAELAERARRSLQFGLLHRSSDVDYIEIKLGDAPGRRPHQDSYCIIRVKLHGTPAATVVDIGSDPFSVIDRATDRVCRLAEAQLRRSGSPHAPQDAAHPS